MFHLLVLFFGGVGLISAGDPQKSLAGHICFDVEKLTPESRKMLEATGNGGECRKVSVHHEIRIVADGKLITSFKGDELKRVDESAFAINAKLKVKKGELTVPATIKFDEKVNDALQPAGEQHQKVEGEQDDAHPNEDKEQPETIVAEKQAEAHSQKEVAKGPQKKTGKPKGKSHGKSAELVLTESDMKRLHVQGKAGRRSVTIKPNYQLDIEGHNDPSSSISIKPGSFAKTGNMMWAGQLMLKPNGEGSKVKRGLINVKMRVSDEVAKTVFNNKVDASTVELNKEDVDKLGISEDAGEPFLASLSHDGRLDPVHGPFEFGSDEVRLSIKPATFASKGGQFEGTVAVKTRSRRNNREKSLGTARATIKPNKKDMATLKKLKGHKLHPSEPTYERIEQVDSPFEHGSPPQHYEGQPQPHCSLSYSSGGSYKTVWFINVGPKVFPLAWRCPSNLRIGKIGDVEGAEPPKGPYKSPFDQCKAGVKSYSKMYNIKKLFRKESSLIKAICKHR
ncbi:hypothetical protein FOL47_007553 [Perkinsus chesapeaki]|uniref:Uncharacterized protein n=1 Tax=Perkinsus chesapeaki TaxID=330153 RepID=A0A7J6MXG8_PERCH|nr:hypothetical protein FOL47_007553 [Perkinsus chesapeaki]